MYNVVLSSRNKNKISELRTLLAEIPTLGINLLSLDDVGFYEDIVEDGNTYEENSVIKASALASRGYICIADDSGLSVRALGGAPGVYSARYGGEHADYALNNKKLLGEMEGVLDRAAEFVCVMSIVLPDSCGVSVPEELIDVEMSEFASNRAGVPVKAVVVRGECKGIIADCYSGDNGFGYDPIFYVEEFGKTYAEMTSEEKNSISHRGQAVKKIIKALEKIFG